MNFIYCITNTINGKRYVGKTTSSLEERFREHCFDSLRERCNKRPLYDAVNKYGVENFIIEELEQVEDETILSDREIYWINELSTFGNGGYNATIGGDGKILYDYKEIIELANLGYDSNQISEKIGCCKDTIYKVLKANGVKLKRVNAQAVMQYDLADNYVLTFYSVTEAMNWLCDHGFAKNNTGYSKITACCKGRSKSAYKYKWKFRDQ